MTSPLTDMQAAHRQFLALVEDIRPELHRYCARMTGSLADGEDVVQDTLARAYYEMSQLRELPALRTWLFRIAHNRAVDHLRRHRETPELVDDRAADEPGADEALALSESMQLAIARFLELAPAQRGCVILKDVLGHSLEEIATTLDLTVPAVKAALHRGRTRLHELAGAAPPHTAAVVRYAELFNARDWDGVRALLADDVRLDLVSREKRAGSRAVGVYLTNYGRATDWRMAPAWRDGREVIAVHRDPGASYVIELTIADGRVTDIRDHRYDVSSP